MSHQIKRSVSLYSFQEEYFHRKMGLEDIIATTEKLDIPGIEIIPDQMMPGYPEVTDEFLGKWHGWMEKYGRTPVCLDMFLDWNKYKGRVMTEDERVESVQRDIVNASKLGCGVIRVIHDVEPGLLERLAPTAEEYGVKLALEIHAPTYFDSPHEQRLLAMFQRVGSPYLGFTLDLGVFVERMPRVVVERLKRDGMSQPIIDYLVEWYNSRASAGGRPGGEHIEEVASRVKELGGSEEEAHIAVIAVHAINAEPRAMLDYMPYLLHIHGKFNEMLPDYTEYSIPYDKIVPVLIEGGYQGYISSEYEGNRWIQDAFQVDSIEQVRRHQVMLKRLLGEE